MGRLYESVGTITGTTRFLYDGDALIAEYDGAGTLLRRYVHGPSDTADDPLAWYEGSAMNSTSLRYLHADRQGSITLASDSAGNALHMFRYDEYGMPQSDATLVPANGARFMYTGQAWIPDVGMYYYKARMYSPPLGRFMQTDPIGYEDQVNLYAYVANDPVNGIDPTGRNTWLVKLAKEGIKKIRQVSTKEAVRLRRGGQHIQGSSRQKALQVERQLSNDPTKLQRHKGHNLKDSEGNLTGETGRPHYQTDGQKGHTFWSVAGGLAMLDQALDAVDQLTNPFYVTEVGDGTCPQAGCGQPMSRSGDTSGSTSDSENADVQKRNGWSIDGSRITGSRACGSRVNKVGC